MLRLFAIISLLLFALYWFHIRLRSEDALAYEKLTQESFALRTRRALEETPANQQREQVQKDIWTQQETRHLQMQSQNSSLILGQKKDKIEAIEHLKNLNCHLQNEFILQADEGFYTYPSHQLIAEQNCHLIQGENQIDGTRIHFDLAQEVVVYENPKGKLTSGPLHFSAKQLIWDKKRGKIHLLDDVHIEQPDQVTLTSQRGTIDLDQLEPSLVVLEDNVQLISSLIQNKKSFAAADTLTYRPIEKTLLFSADPKVLFWQEGLSLSASEVLIHQDQTIEGHGDVHFTFNLDEQNYIDELFKQYL